jgi:hypothetical protein
LTSGAKDTRVGLNIDDDVFRIVLLQQFDRTRWTSVGLTSQNYDHVGPLRVIHHQESVTAGYEPNQQDGQDDNA